MDVIHSFFFSTCASPAVAAGRWGGWCWSLSRPARNTLDTCLSQGHIERRTTVHTHTCGQFKAISVVCVLVFGLREEAGVPKQNPGRRRKNIQTPYKKAPRPVDELTTFFEATMPTTATVCHTKIVLIFIKNKIHLGFTRENGHLIFVNACRHSSCTFSSNQ